LAKGQIIQKAFKLKAPERCFKFKILNGENKKFLFISIALIINIIILKSENKKINFFYKNIFQKLP